MRLPVFCDACFKTHADIERALVAPLRAAGMAVTIVGVDVWPGDALVDHQRLRRESVRVVPYDHFESWDQATVDADLRRLCRTTEPGCARCAKKLAACPFPDYRKKLCPGHEYCAVPPRMRCPPFTAEASANPEKTAYIQTPYRPRMQLNAYRQLHTEARVALHLNRTAARARGVGQTSVLTAPRSMVAIALGSDFAPLANFTISVADVLAASRDPSTLYTSNQNDRGGFTDGFLLGHPTPVVRVLSRLHAMSAARDAGGLGQHGGAHGVRPEALGTREASYEVGLRSSLERLNLTRRVTCMRFVKIRAHGGLDYARCLDKSAWLTSCSPLTTRAVPPLQGVHRCPASAEEAELATLGDAQEGHADVKATAAEDHATAAPAASLAVAVRLRAAAPMPFGECMHHKQGTDRDGKSRRRVKTMATVRRRVDLLAVADE